MSTPQRDFAALEARRLQAARLFARGASQAAVAQQLGVTRVSAHHWYHAWKVRGRPGLKGAGRAGRIWDSLAGHKSALMRAYLARQRGWLTVEPLPGYAPELNPVEQVWGNLKGRELANVCARDLPALHAPLRAGCRRLRASALDAAVQFSSSRRVRLPAMNVSIYAESY